MRNLRVSLLILSLFAPAIAQGPKAPTLHPEYKGPVHTALITIKQLAPDPRAESKLHVYTPAVWQVFDRQGQLIEQSTGHSEDGKPFGIARMVHGSDGSETSTSQNLQGETFVNRYETRGLGPRTTEHRHYLNDVLVDRAIDEQDELGHEVHSHVFSPPDRLVVDVENISDATGRTFEWIIRRGDGGLDKRMQTSFDSEGNVIGRRELDDSGRVVCNISLDKTGELTSWSRTPGWNGNCSLGWNDSVRGLGKDYVATATGLEVKTERHPGRKGNLENDEMERRTEAGVLLEKVTFTYERDNYGNWTRRVVSAWNPETGEMVAIREDRRTLTYYSDVK